MNTPEAEARLFAVVHAHYEQRYGAPILAHTDDEIFELCEQVAIGASSSPDRDVDRVAKQRADGDLDVAARGEREVEGAMNARWPADQVPSADQRLTDAEEVAGAAPASAARSHQARARSARQAHAEGSVMALRVFLWFAGFVAFAGYCGIVYVAGHFSPTATIAAMVLWLFVFGRRLIPRHEELIERPWDLLPCRRCRPRRRSRNIFPSGRVRSGAPISRA